MPLTLKEHGELALALELSEAMTNRVNALLDSVRISLQARRHWYAAAH